MDRIDFIKKYIKGDVILDIGCLGPEGNRFIELMHLYPNKKFYGLDNNQKLIESLGLTNVVSGDIHNLPFNDIFFDTVYMGEIIEHTWNPGIVIKEVYRVLKSDGRLILDTPNVFSILKIIKFLFFGKDDIVGDPDHRIIFSPIAIYNLLQESGFNVLDLKFKNITSVKGRQISLPNFGLFKRLGAQVLLSADKVSTIGKIELQLSVKNFFRR